MTQVSCNILIDVSAESIWQVIGDLGAAGQYLAGVVTCTVVGEGAGARRTLTYTDGSTVIERLEVLSAPAHQLSYLLLADTPFRNCLTTMTVRDLGASQAELAWSATFEPDGLPASEAAALLECALAANCQELKQFMEAGRK